MTDEPTDKPENSASRSTPSLSADDRVAIWQAINKKIATKLRRRRLFRLRALSVAAVFLAALVFGWWLLPMNATNHDQSVWAQMAGNVKSTATATDEVRVSLADGRILNVQDNTTITYSDSLLDIHEPDAVHNRQIAFGNGNEAGYEAAYHTITVPYGKRVEVVLPDGSTVWLNAGSVFRFPNAFRNTRTAYLMGEGFFEVRTNKDSPFFVHTQDMEIQVLGTSFNVSAYEDDGHTTTTLVEGSVALSTDKGNFQRRQLKPGEQATFIRDTKTLAVRKDDELGDVLWRKRQLMLRKEPFEEVIRRLERMYNAKIELPDVDHTTATFSGSLDLSQPAVKVLGYLFNDQIFTIEQRERRIIVKRK